MNNQFQIYPKELIALSSKCYSYICKNNIKDNKNKLKNNIIHSKGTSNSYKNKYIDHMLFKKTLLENVLNVLNISACKHISNFKYISKYSLIFLQFNYL